MNLRISTGGWMSFRVGPYGESNRSPRTFASPKLADPITRGDMSIDMITNACKCIPSIYVGPKICLKRSNYEQSVSSSR